jgi:signal transduction histidine kinase
MDQISLIWGGVIAIYLLLAWIHLLMFLLHKGERYHLLFVSSSIFAIFLAAVEISAMKTMDDSIGNYQKFLLAGHFSLCGITGSILLFIHLYFKAGRRWLVWLVVSSRLLVLLLNLLITSPFNFVDLISIKRVSFLDGTFPVPVGVTSSRTFIGTITWLLYISFSIDVLQQIWRRKGDRKGLIVALSLLINAVLFLHATLFGVLGYWGGTSINFLALPIYSTYFLIVALAMSFEISREVIRASRLSVRLEENELSLTLAVKAARIEVWSYDYHRDEFSVSSHVRSLLGFAPDFPISLEAMQRKVDFEGKSQLIDQIRQGKMSSMSLNIEALFKRPDDSQGWFTAIGEVDCDAARSPVSLRGVALDITERKLAEKMERQLSGMLINAHEEERTRLARELHDHLAQSVALHSIELGLLSKKPPADRAMFMQRMEAIKVQVEQISSDIRILSHRLHPANLRRLGLVPAIRGLCREMSSAHEIAIDFRQAGDSISSSTVPDEISLCLYRITQEALRNVVRHSQATQVTVDLNHAEGLVQLVVVDDGIGFSVEEAVKKTSLGLISMRERARLVQGDLSIRSSVGSGTTIAFLVPLENQLP